MHFIRDFRLPTWNNDLANKNQPMSGEFVKRP